MWVDGSTVRHICSSVNILSVSVEDLTEVPTVSFPFLFTTGLSWTHGRLAYQIWEDHKTGENRLLYKIGKPRFKILFKIELGWNHQNWFLTFHSEY